MATASAELIEIATRHAVHYEKLKSHEVKSFDDFLKLLNEDLIKQLSRSDITLFTRARLEKQLDLVREIIKEIYKDYHSEWKTNLVEVGKYEAEFEKKALDRVVINREFVLPAEGQIAAAVFTRPLSVNGIDGGALLDQFFEQLPDNTIKRVEGAIRLGFAQGQTTQQVINRIRGTAKAKFSDGLMALSKRDADIITRTALQHVSSQSRQATWERNGDIIKGIKIVATLDSRTCLVKGSLINTPSGERPIESIRKGDFVIGGSGIIRRVTADTKAKSKRLCKIKLSNGKVIICTDDHLIWTNRGWVEAQYLLSGEELPDKL